MENISMGDLPATEEQNDHKVTILGQVFQRFSIS